MTTSPPTDIGTAARFEFGENWRRFLAGVNEDRIAKAEASLRAFLGVETLAGKRFLDIGSGSGLFSLAARRLGASVVSFDYDPQSVACTEELRRRYSPDDAEWRIERGSALDASYLRSLGAFDIVYSWGVLHHTGQMWRALELAEIPVAPNGKLYIAIYNDQDAASRRWTAVKRAYNRSRGPLRWATLAASTARLWGPTIVRDTLRGRPMASWRAYGQDRGMSPWRDVVDWVGGWPFEVAKPEQILDFYRARGFELTRLKTCGGGRGCNEFLFERRA
jgi:2-polyprenyl-6-hydroxyphenyl methylase/3-demethylubiquinone-9 3-methyltransferase